MARGWLVDDGPDGQTLHGFGWACQVLLDGGRVRHADMDRACHLTANVEGDLVLRRGAGEALGELYIVTLADLRRKDWMEWRA